MSDWTIADAMTDMFGDHGPWIESLPTAWRAVAWPEGPWTPPDPPWLAADSSHPENEDLWPTVRASIRYWTPLLHLAYGSLGWVDPAIGAVRWVQAGMPDDDPALEVMRRWWGPLVQSLWLWARESDALDHASSSIASATRTTYHRRPADPAWTLTRDPSLPGDVELARHQSLFTGGGDGLHLSGHVPNSLVGADSPLLRNRPPTHQFHTHGDSPHAALLLDRYAGWYRILHEVGASVPDRPDGRNWRVTVVVKTLGSLGEYRRSAVTGRWFAGRHRHHVLGWAGAS